jgi:hypothetical protein
MEISGITETQAKMKKKTAKGRYIVASCCLCGVRRYFVGQKAKEVLKSLTDAGWRYYEDKESGINGLYCGCNSGVTFV